MSKISIDIGTGKVRKPSNLVVGIDLGTTNSLVAIYNQEKGHSEALAGRSGKKVITPSVVHFDADSGSFIVGDEARKLLISNPEQTIYSVKRLLGKSYQDIASHADQFGYKIIDGGEDSLVKIQLGNRFYSPIELSAEILKELKFKAEKTLGSEVTKAVITVPAYFNDTQRQATRDAGKLAGMEVLRIVNEPTAASLAYGLNQISDVAKNIAVYDLGGGTFDVSVLRIESGVFEVLSTHGDTYLGGDDIDREIMQYWEQQHKALSGLLQSNEKSAELRLLAEEAKIYLSGNNEFKTNFFDVEISLNKTQFEDLVRPILEKTMSSCKLAVADSNLNIDEIQEVILVGGSTRIPMISSMVESYFSSAHINSGLNPDEVVALGAAVEADILAGNRTDMLLLDVTPLSLGIETMGGLMDIIIPRNSKVPNSAGRNYTTSIDGQVNLQIAVYQGERDQVAQNRKLGEFILKNIPAMPAGLPKIQITFILNADGMLKVKAMELRSGVSQEVEVLPKYGLTDEQVENMLLESMKNAQTDMDYRSLKEAVNEASYLIKSTEKFVANNPDAISPQQSQEIARIIDQLQKQIQLSNKDGILSVYESLNAYTKPFAESVMDKVIAKALTGKSIN